VWVGGYDEICRLQPDHRGKLHAVSVLDRLPVEERSFGQVMHALSTPDGIYFASSVRLILFRPDGTTHSWPLDVRINGLWWQDDALHASLGTDGAARLTSTGLQTVAPPPAGDAQLSPASFAVLNFRKETDGSLLLLTSRGIFRWEGGDAPIEPIAPESRSFFEDRRATTAAFLPDGRIAFGFINVGLAIFDATGRLTSQVTRANGLPSNRLEHITNDLEGGLWIAQRSGISRVQIDDRFAVHGLAQGIPGSPRTLHRFGHRLYIAHNEGAAWRDDSTGQVNRITGLQEGLNTFLEVGDRLFATGTGIYELKADDTVQLMLPHALTSLEAMPKYPGWFIGSNPSGAWLFQFDGKQWKESGRITAISEGISSLYVDAQGDVWCSPYSGRGAWRLRFDQSPSPDVPGIFLSEKEGLPSVRRRDRLQFCEFEGELFATTGQWARRFDPTTQRFAPISSEFNDAGPVAHATSSDGRLWWFLSPPQAQLVEIVRGAHGRITQKPVLGGPVTDIIANRIYYDAITDNIWIASQGALLSADLSWTPSTPPLRLRVIIRRLATPDGEVLYSGAHPRNLSHQLDPLPPSQNALNFSFAAPTHVIDYRGRNGTLYRTRLEGMETQWTDWSPQATRTFTNLPYRNLKFHVQARNLAGVISEETSLAFTLQSPWWLSNWAILGYAATGALIFYGFVRLRTRALLRRAAELSAVVGQRTEELATRNRELARLHKLEFNEKTAAKLGEEKAQLEMLRYQLNPHFLYNALGSIRSLIHTRPDEADQMTTQLADFCRMTLTRGDGEGGTLASELRMISSYLDMERTRWRELLRTKIDAAPDTLTLRVPPFLLLPLVENAIKYGTRTSIESVEVIITVRRLDTSGVFLEVANTGRWVEPTGTRTPFSTGIGLDNLRQRLQRYFPGAHEFHINTAGDWVRVSLKISSTAHFKPTLEHAQGTAY
jgi:hypothetical protein